MFNAIIAGVGGQGSLLASRVLGRVLGSRYADVNVSEVHGMSQRGGSVVTYVRGGDSVASPIVPQGECDLLLALEGLEALRWIHHLRPEGTLVASSQRIDPMPVLTGVASYPENVEKTAAERVKNCVFLPAVELAGEAGGARAANVVLLGAASALSGIDEALWLEALRACVPPKFIEMNLKAFALGRKAAREE